MATEKKKTALYGVHFKGVFGRNRSVKFKANRNLVECPEGTTELAFVTQIATDFAIDIKPKAGNLRVIVYRNGEITHDTVDGRVYTTYLYQPYDAQTLYGLTFEAGKAGEAFISEACREPEGTEGQDRDTYSDDQDRDSYTVKT